MELDNTQEGPLKANEIIRLLEASKNSTYKKADSFFNQKEKNFQHKTLLQIATETSDRLRERSEPAETEENATQIVKEVSNLDTPTSDSATENLENSEPVISEDEIEAQKLSETLEKQKLENKKIAEDNYDKGVQDGKDESKGVQEEKILSALKALDEAKSTVLDLNSTQFIKLRDKMSEQILSLASERAGLEISRLPEPFIEKIESLIETIDKNTRTPTIYLNKQDLEVVKSFLRDEDQRNYILKSKPELVCGDVIVDIDSISASDQAAQRSGYEISDLNLNQNVLSDSSVTAEYSPETDFGTLEKKEEDDKT